MTRYVCLLRFTDQGSRAIQDSPKRAKAFARSAQRAGVAIEAQLWTAGSYDGVLILKAEDDASILRCLTDLASKGNVRTESVKAFDAEEFQAIVR